MVGHSTAGKRVLGFTLLKAMRRRCTFEILCMATLHCPWVHPLGRSCRKPRRIVNNRVGVMTDVIEALRDEAGGSPTAGAKNRSSIGSASRRKLCGGVLARV